MTWNLRAWALLPLGVIFCYWTFLFSRSKDSDAKIGIIAILVHFERTLMTDGHAPTWSGHYLPQHEGIYVT